MCKLSVCRFAMHPFLFLFIGKQGKTSYLPYLTKLLNAIETLYYQRCCILIVILPCVEASDGLCFKLTQICAKPQSVLWAMERGKHDEFTTRKDTIHFIKKVGGGQFAEVWLGKC